MLQHLHISKSGGTSWGEAAGEADAGEGPPSRTARAGLGNGLMGISRLPLLFSPNQPSPTLIPITLSRQHPIFHARAHAPRPPPGAATTPQAPTAACRRPRWASTCGASVTSAAGSTCPPTWPSAGATASCECVSCTIANGNRRRVCVGGGCGGGSYVPEPKRSKQSRHRGGGVQG